MLKTMLDVQHLYYLFKCSNADNDKYAFKDAKLNMHQEKSVYF